MAMRGSRGGEHCAAEREKKGSLHTVDLRHPIDLRVVNNSHCFLLAFNKRVCDKRAELKSRSDQNFSSACLRVRIA